MDHTTLIQLTKELGETPGFCNWCEKWMGESKLRKFMGQNVCFGCYQRFKRFVEGMTTDDAIKWFFRRIDAEVDIQLVSKTEYIIRVRSIRALPENIES